MIEAWAAALSGRRGMTLCACVLLALGQWMAGTLLLLIAAALVRRDAARIAEGWTERLHREAREAGELAEWRGRLRAMRGRLRA